LSLTLDEKLQLAVATGTCIAGAGSFFAAAVALYLGQRSEKIKLRVSFGIRINARGNFDEKFLSIRATNEGVRKLIIEGLVLSCGKGKERITAFAANFDALSDKLPKELSRGESATFVFSLKEHPDMFGHLIKDRSEKNLKTLRLLIYPSIGREVSVKPEPNLIEYLSNLPSSDDK
jgi:hypothetical protein